MNEVEQHQQEVPFHVNYIKALCVQYTDCEISTWRYVHDFNELKDLRCSSFILMYKFSLI